MDLFKPSKEILEEICTDDNLISQYSILPRNQSEKLMRKNLTSFSFGITSQVAWRYGLGNAFDNIGYLGKSSHLVMELLKNAFGHGAQDRDVEFGLFLGDEGICYGIKDGGNYFKLEDTKKIWESKSKIPKRTKDKRKLSGYGVGVRFHIFPFSDMIEVDANKGILYCVQFKRNLDKIIEYKK